MDDTEIEKTIYARQVQKAWLKYPVAPGGHAERRQSSNPLDAVFDAGSRALAYADGGSLENPRRTPKLPAVSDAISLDELIAAGDPAPNGVYSLNLQSVLESAPIDPLATIRQHSRCAQYGSAILLAAPRDRAFAINTGDKTEGLFGLFSDTALFRVIDPAPFSQTDVTAVAGLTASPDGAGYTDGTYALTVTNAAGDMQGAGAAGTATISGGAVTATTVTAGGTGYILPPTFTLPPAAGTPTTPAVFTAALGCLTPSAWPTYDASITWGDAPNYAFSVQITRPQNLAVGGGTVLRAALLESILRGCGQLADRVLLSAIAATTPANFALGAPAAKALKFGDLRGLVGTSGTGATIRADGKLVAGPGIEAELTPVMSGTIIGAWQRAAVAVWPELVIIGRRIAVDGSVELICYANFQAALPDPGSFWGVSA